MAVLASPESNDEKSTLTPTNAPILTKPIPYQKAREWQEVLVSVASRPAFQDSITSCRNECSVPINLESWNEMPPKAQHILKIMLGTILSTLELEQSEQGVLQLFTSITFHKDHPVIHAGVVAFRLLLAMGPLHKLPVEDIELVSLFGNFMFSSKQPMSLILQQLKKTSKGAYRFRDSLRQEVVRLLALSEEQLAEQDVPAGFPKTEEGLCALANQLIDLESLEDMVRETFHQRPRSVKGMYSWLVLCGVTSPAKLRQHLTADCSSDQAYAVPNGKAKCMLNEMLQLQHRSGEHQQAVCLTSDEVKALDAVALNLADRRVDLTEAGPAPCLVTAPHNINLCRDGDKPHRMEESTTAIALRIAKHLKGCCMSWTRSTQHRSSIGMAIAKRRGLEDLEGAGGYLDAGNRDPNFLKTEELDSNPWFTQMSALSAKWRRGQTDSPLLHVDVHGCRDPPCHGPAHLHVGLGAMVQAPNVPVDRVSDFAEALREELYRVISGLELQEGSEDSLVEILVPVSAREPEKLSGAWPEGTGRLTQTQQATCFANFTHSCQLEMSRTLRKKLASDPAACVQIADALRAAWIRA